MRVSQRLDYGVRMLVALAGLEGDDRAPVGQLAASLGMPRRFLEQQMTALGKAGIVACRRGTGGGCALGRPADQISVEEVVRALEGDVLDVPHTADSAVAEMWVLANRALGEHLRATTIADLLAHQREIDGPSRQMYYI
ncbi:MAG: RrF2 family transcriptional regulator [Coriobacteriia bacterium]